MSRRSLPILETMRRVRVVRGGRLAKWLGPALRGMVALRWKWEVCQQPEAERHTRWRYCKGCPHMATCSYGQCIEPDPPAGVTLPGGANEAPRPFLIAPTFPVSVRAWPGYIFPVRTIFIGAARQHAATFERVWEMVLADERLGLGEERVLLQPVHDVVYQEHDLELPVPTFDVPLAWVRVRLTAPLSLMVKKELIRQPTFADLLRAGMRTLGLLCRCAGAPLPDAVFGQLKELAATVPTLDAHFVPFEQGRRSNRQQQEWDIRGMTGEGIYGPVPRSLVTWLQAAGMVHVGTNRIAGAGGWTVEIPRE